METPIWFGNAMAAVVIFFLGSMFWEFHFKPTLTDWLGEFIDKRIESRTYWKARFYHNDALLHDLIGLCARHKIKDQRAQVITTSAYATTTAPVERRVRR